MACDGVDLTLRAGQVHGVLGENGAGKSTLMKVLIGLVQPDEGRVLLDGVPRRIPDPQTAAALGIGMVHQHFSLVEPLTVWENVVLGDDARLDRRRARDLVAEIGEYYGLALDPDARVADLSAGNRQRVELLKCLRRKPRVVVLDEPTSVLTPQESEGLFAAMREIVARDLQAAVLVSHKLAEVLHATDVVTIMRHGRVVDHHPTAGATAASLARSMVGRSVSLRDEAAALGATDIVEEVATETAAEDAARVRPRGAADHRRHRAPPRRRRARRARPRRARRRDRRGGRRRGQRATRARRPAVEPDHPRPRAGRGRRPDRAHRAGRARWPGPASP